MRRLVAVHHRGQPAPDAPVEDAHPGSRRERPHHVGSLLVGQPAQVQLVMVAQEGRPLRHSGQLGQGAEGLDERFGLLPSQGQPKLGIEQEGEQHVGPVVRLTGAGGAVRRQVLGVDVGLAQEHGLSVPPLHVLTPVVQDREVLGARVDVGRHLFQHERRGVDPEPGRAELEPERHDLVHLGADLGVRPVQVGLEVVEPMEVPRAGPAVVRPGLGLLAGEDDSLAPVRRFALAPDVPVPVRRRRIRTRGLEPRVLVRGVVDHQVDEQPDPAGRGPGWPARRSRRRCPAEDRRRRSR